MLITDRNGRFCGFPRRSSVRIGSQRIIPDFTRYAVFRIYIRAYVGFAAQGHAAFYYIRSGSRADRDRVFPIGYRLISDSCSVFHGRIGAAADRRTAISHLFLPDITYIGASAQCYRVFAVYFGLRSDRRAHGGFCNIFPINNGSVADSKGFLRFRFRLITDGYRLI